MLALVPQRDVCSWSFHIHLSRGAYYYYYY